MRERIERLVPGSTQGLWVGTFHSLFSRLLRFLAPIIGIPKDFTIFDDQDQKTLVTQILKEMGLSDHVSARAILSGIDQAKNRGLGPDEYKGRDYFTDLIARIYPIYQERLTQAKALDFGDLLLLPLKFIKHNEHFRLDLANRFDYVLVDEFQDVNLVQYQLVRHLAWRSRQILVVGDDDQAIYGWRGADVQNLLAFEEDWRDAKVVKLEQNYRSTSIILKAANAVISRNRDRFGKNLFTEQKGGDLIEAYEAWDERREATYVVRTLKELVDNGFSITDCAIFYRTNAQSRVIEEALRNEGLPYTVIGGMRFYERAEVRDILAYLRVVHHPEDEIALRRIINVPTRGIGEATLETVTLYAREHKISLWDGLCGIIQSPDLLGSGPRKKLEAFQKLILSLQNTYKVNGLSALSDAIIEQTGYLERLSLDRSPESESRRENVMEFLSSIREAHAEAAFKGEELSLGDYLDQIALVSAVDGNSKGVSLMTMHAAKGLEFRAVFITGLEEGLFPSLRNREEHSAISEPLEEERRLAYVAITRAKERLFLSYAKQRRLYGQLPKLNEPSRFLQDIPVECLKEIATEHPQYPYATSFGAGWSYHHEQEQDQELEEPFSSWEEDFNTTQRKREPLWKRQKYSLQMRPRQAAESSSDGYGGKPPQAYSYFSNSAEHGSLDPVVEYDDASNARGTFRLGQIVEHAQFGRGAIRAFSGIGPGLKLVVAFDSVGPKTVMARFISKISSSH